MTMLKGYTIPSPGAADGEYGGISFAGYAASPAQRSYWEGQGVANTMPALNGFGGEMEDDAAAAAMAQPNGEPLPILALVLGAVAGRMLIGGVKGMLVGAGAAYVFRKKLPRFAGFGNALVAPPPGEHCAPGSESWCYEPPNVQPMPPARTALTPSQLISGSTGTPIQAVPATIDPMRAAWVANEQAGGAQDKAGTFLIAALVGLKFLL